MSHQGGCYRLLAKVPTFTREVLGMSLDPREYRKLVHEGWQAHIAGKDASNNPYTDERASAWFAGWETREYYQNGI